MGQGWAQGRGRIGGAKQGEAGCRVGLGGDRAWQGTAQGGVGNSKAKVGGSAPQVLSRVCGAGCVELVEVYQSRPGWVGGGWVGESSRTGWVTRSWAGFGWNGAWMRCDRAVRDVTGLTKFVDLLPEQARASTPNLPHRARDRERLVARHPRHHPVLHRQPRSLPHHQVVRQQDLLGRGPGAADGDPLRPARVAPGPGLL